jgi:hypothetical protein
MTPSERTEILAKMAAGREDLAASLAGMSDEEAGRRPSEHRWSALGNVEHLTFVEANMLRLLKNATPVDGEPQMGREAGMFEMVKSRAGKMAAPPPAQPKGEVSTIAEALEKFDAARANTIAFVETCDRDLRRCTMVHPVAGPLTGMECIHVIAAHPFRHAGQIRELRGAR